MLGKSCHHEHDKLCTFPPGSPVVYPIVHNNADMNKMAKSQTFEPIKIVHNDSRVSLEPFRHQFALTIPGKMKRDTSYGSTYSNMSAKEQIQNQHDMLQLNDQQLSLEDMAEMVTGSLSLVNGENSSDELQKVILYSVRSIIATSVESKLGVKTSLLLRDAEVVNSQKSDIDITKFSILSNIPCLVDLVDEMSKCFHSYFLFLYS
jgi:hypothetical protein